MTPKALKRKIPMTVQNFLKHDGEPQSFTLSPGAHASREEGMCAMEMVAWLAGEPHSDYPRCASTVICLYVQTLNDAMSDDVRPHLIPFLPKLIGTAAADEVEHARSDFLAWKAIRLFTPAALRVSGYAQFARKLERQKTFWKARVAAEGILAALGKKERHKREDNRLTAVELAVHRSFKAASWADWTHSQWDRPFEPIGVSSLDCCAATAAGAAYFAYEAGCQTIWPLALQALDEVLTIEAEREPKTDTIVVSFPRPDKLDDAQASVLR